MCFGKKKILEKLLELRDLRLFSVDFDFASGTRTFFLVIDFLVRYQALIFLFFIFSKITPKLL